MSKPHFLCCLPIRLGAFVVSLATLLLASLDALIGWLAVYFDHTHRNNVDLTTRQLVLVILWSTSHTLLAIFAFFGLIGVLSKRIGWVSTFASYLQGFVFGLSIIAIVNIVFLFIDHDGNCVIGSDKHGNCVNRDDTSLSRGAVIAIALCLLIVPLLIMAYGCWILSDCVKYLYDRDSRTSVSLYPFSSSYAAVPSRDKEEHTSLTHGV